MSIGLNILMTLGIAGRMLYLRRSIVDVLGPQHAKLYTGIAAMFVESGAVYSIWGLIFIICYARNSNVQNIVLGILDQAVVRSYVFPSREARPNSPFPSASLQN
jgi:hypothetical protein